MKINKNKLIGCLLAPIVLSFLFCFSPIAQGRTVERIAAVVNGDVITLLEFNKEYNKLAPKLNEIEDLEERTETEKKLRMEVMDRMIEEKLFQQEVKRLGLSVTDDQIELGIKEIMRQNNMTKEEFTKSLQDEGINYEEFRKDVERQILQIKFIKRVIEPKVEITETDAKNYYVQNKDELVKEEKIRLSQILIMVPEKATAADWKEAEKRIRGISKKLEEGKEFEKLAKEYSDGPSAEAGGDLGYFELKNLSPELKDTVEKLKKDQYSEPLKGDIGWQIIKYTDRITGASKSFEDLKDVIIQRLEERQVTIEYRQYFLNLRQKAEVDIKI